MTDYAKTNELVNKRCNGYLTRGFYPVKWAQHPQEIRDAIHQIGFRPLLKQCYRNSQLLVIYNEHLGLGLELEYREGWAALIIPFEHAWLIHKGEILDLTIDNDDMQYAQSCGYAPEQIRVNMVATGTYGSLTDGRRFSEMYPHRKMRAQLNGGNNS